MPAFTPEEFFDEEVGAGSLCGPATQHWISVPGGLTQFGALIEELPPGSRSAHKHWHAAEDELIYILSGAGTLIEGDTERAVSAGDAATFRAGVPLGHCLVNTSDAPLRYLVVGTRADQDRVTYPDHDRVLHIDGANRRWTDLFGTPAAAIDETSD